MKFSPRHARIKGLLLIAAVFVLDQYSKKLFVKVLALKDAATAICPFFNINLVLNRGISFGMLAEAASWLPQALILGTSLIVLILAFWLLRAREQTVVMGLSFIIGGALGNIVDRIHYGFVVDFLDFHLGSHHWPAFNVADIAVFMGVVILVFMSIVRPETDL